jgi:hypothetical protein
LWSISCIASAHGDTGGAVWSMLDTAASHRLDVTSPLSQLNLN